jgi:hypothetical protein
VWRAGGAGLKYAVVAAQATVLKECACTPLGESELWQQLIANIGCQEGCSSAACPKWFTHNTIGHVLALPSFPCLTLAVEFRHCA